jgi:hypothetical protein
MNRMKQTEFTALFVQRPQNFAWFLGAGASRSSGLPTATDILLDLKLRYYCREENQRISRQDMQNDAVKARIQEFMDSRGFPPLWSEDEYTKYFEMIFGEDRERQRRYINAILSEEQVSLSLGNRVLGALLSAKLSRVVFTTNFDSVVEKSVAEVGGKSLSAYHLEAAHNAKNALDNEEYPIYCKLHGDFRYDSIKNLSDDLATQNLELSTCLITSASRFGFIVAGYSGRDTSVMDLFHQALETHNPFPHGLFWTGIGGSSVHPAVTSLLDRAQEKGVNAQFIAIETYDAFMNRLWRNTSSPSPELDAKVRKSQFSEVNIDFSSAGRDKPIIRMNALPLISAPEQCLSLLLRAKKEWIELRKISYASERSLIFTQSDTVWCWGDKEAAKKAFDSDLESISTRPIPRALGKSENLHVKAFLEEALCAALCREKPLLYRTRIDSNHLIADSHAVNVGGLDPLFQVVGNTSGNIPGLYAASPSEDSSLQQVGWAESLRISIEHKDGQLWLLIDPDIWIWPPNARKLASKFLDERRADRYNNKYNQLLDAWVEVILGTDEKNIEIEVSSFSSGSSDENPTFRIGSRTAFSRRLRA